jgi:hypothetical protein
LLRQTPLQYSQSSLYIRRRIWSRTGSFCTISGRIFTIDLVTVAPDVRITIFRWCSTARWSLWEDLRAHFTAESAEQLFDEHSAVIVFRGRTAISRPLACESDVPRNFAVVHASGRLTVEPKALHDLLARLIVVRESPKAPPTIS